MEQWLPKLPIAVWVDDFVNWLTTNLEVAFDGVTTILESVVEGMVAGFGFIPSYVFIILLTLIAWKVSNKGIGLFTLVGLFLVDNLGYWEPMLETLALVLTAVFISILLGIPMGIWASQKQMVKSIVVPVLDFMQTMPAFVYLIPAIFFFNIGVVPGVVASVIFAMPPTIRLTILGIQQVPADIIEATEAFGSTTSQKLLKVQLPLAMPTIMAGINQSIMLALSMVVIASMVGAPGLGADVYRAVTQIQIGKGFEAGLSIVVIAIILDRITQNIGKSKKQGGTVKNEEKMDGNVIGRFIGSRSCSLWFRQNR
jgi:glycine betaine/proline transport system permease protein